MTRLMVSLLGPLRVTRDGRPAGDFGYEKVRALLAYLLVEADRPHQRAALAALLWPDAPEGAARKSLRNALSTLRQALGDATAQPPFLLITRDTVQVNPAAEYVLDVASFGALLDAAAQHAHLSRALCPDCAVQLAEVVTLYCGAFLAQVAVSDSVAFEEWAALIRERLHRQVIDVMSRLMAYHERRGEDEAAGDYAWRALALESWDEAAHRCLMRVLARSGQRAAALAQYERCRQVLVEELGVEPVAETTALYERIRAELLEVEVGTPIVPHTFARTLLPRSAKTNLPTPPNSLIGRAQDVTCISARLRQDSVRLLTLIGPPGIGKTRLGLQVAWDLVDTFADGVWFIPLASIHDPGLVAAAIAQPLGVQETADQPLGELLQRYLREKALLLMLDNFEHLASAAQPVAELLAACPRLKILVTSRAALHLQAERQFPLAPLALPDPALLSDVEAVARAPAIALFVDRAQAVRHDFILQSRNVADVVAICQRLDGLPLAIELAAGRSKNLAPQMLLQRLAHRLALLTGGMRDAPDRQQTLRAAIAWSYDLLDTAEQALFCRLAVFVGGFTLDAAEGVLRTEAQGLSDGMPDSVLSPQSSILDGLAALVEQSLVQQIMDADGEPRFMLLETIREYAREQLHASGEAGLAQRRHVDYYLALAETAAPALTGPEQGAWFQRLEREHGNLRAALHWVHDQRLVELLGRLTAPLWQFWYIRGHLSEGWRWFEAALAQRGTMSMPVRAKVLYGASWLARVQRDFGLASALLEESLELYYALEDEHGISLALRVLGTAVFFQGDHARATMLIEQSLALSRAIGDQRQIAMALCHLGLIASNQGNYTRATALFEDTLARVLELGDQRSIGDSRANLGLIALAQGDAARAQALLEESLAIYRALQDKRLVGIMLNNLGTVALAQAEYTQARELCEQSLGIFLEVSHTGGIAQALRCLGEVAAAQGNAAEGRALLEESLTLSRRLVDKVAVAGCLNSLGRVALRQGNVTESLELHRESLILFRDLGNSVAIARVLESLASVATAQTQPILAARLWGAAERLREAAGAPMSRHERGDYEHSLAAARAQIDVETFTVVWQAGRASTLEAAITEALAIDPPGAFRLIEMESVRHGF